MDGRELGAGFPTDARMSLLMAAGEPGREGKSRERDPLSSLPSRSFSRKDLG